MQRPPPHGAFPQRCHPRLPDGGAGERGHRGKLLSQPPRLIPLVCDPETGWQRAWLRIGCNQGRIDTFFRGSLVFTESYFLIGPAVLEVSVVLEELLHMSARKLLFGLIAGVLLAGTAPPPATASIINPATDPIIVQNGNSPQKTYDWSTLPAAADTWLATNYQNDILSFSGQNTLARVTNAISSITGVIPVAPNLGGTVSLVTNPTNNATWSTTGPGANLFGIHIGGGAGGGSFIIALLSGATTSFTISNLPFGVSDIFAFNAGRSTGDPGATPLPGALLLFGTGLGAMGLWSSRRKRTA